MKSKTACTKIHFFNNLPIFSPGVDKFTRYIAAIITDFSFQKATMVNKNADFHTIHIFTQRFGFVKINLAFSWKTK